MAIWEKLFSKITFKNYPNTSTPINADNLNKMTDAIDGIDDRVVELNSNLKDQEGQLKTQNGASLRLQEDGNVVRQMPDGSYWAMDDIIRGLGIYGKSTDITGNAIDVPSDTWVKTSCDIVVDKTGEYMVLFPFFRNQGGGSTPFRDFIFITDNDSISNNVYPHMGCIAIDWSTNSIGGRIFKFYANTKYHVFIKHFSNLPHTIDFFGQIYKIAD